MLVPASYCDRVEEVNMRQPYEAPEITVLGSLTDLTQAHLFGESSDQLTWILPILGDDNYS